MTIEKNIDGAVVISDIIDGHLVSRYYYYYSPEQARSMFVEEVYNKTKREQERV